MNSEEHYQLTHTPKRVALTEKIYQATKGTVQSGLFKGMVLNREQPWDDSNFCTKLMGTYEHDLAPLIQLMLDLKPPRAVNVGVGEGYYAVGLALQGLAVVALDINDKCLRATAINAASNQVKVTTINPEIELAFDDVVHPGDFILMDCEGHEWVYIDPERNHNLKSCPMIIELHDCMLEGITPLLTKRLSSTHNLTVIIGVPVNTTNLKGILQLTDDELIEATYEFRPIDTRWMVAIPK